MGKINLTPNESFSKRLLQTSLKDTDLTIEYQKRWNKNSKEGLLPYFL